MQSLDNFKTATKETTIRGNRNVVPMENTTDLMDCKKLKCYEKLTQPDHS